MRILHVLAQLPARTGSGVYYQNLIRGLGERGFEQRALFAVQDGEKFDFLPPECQYPVEFRSPELPFPIAGMSDIMPYTSTVYSRMDREMLDRWRAAFQNALERAEAAFHPETVILHHLWMLTALGVEAFPEAVKIGVCHNTDLRQAERRPDLRERYVTNLHRLDGVFALSGGQRASIKALFGIPGERVTVLGGGYDEALFYPPPVRRPRGRVELVYASKIDPAKGIYALLEAFETVCRACPEVHLNVVGTPDGENRERLGPYLDRGLPVTLLPAMRQSHLADFFRTMDVYVMPSFFEGLGLTALEALACGLRVAAAENPGLVGLLGERINACGVVEYVTLPRMEAVDRPMAEDLPAFSERLAAKLLRQIGRVERGEPWPDEAAKRLALLSWRGIAERAAGEIARLAHLKENRQA